MQSLTLILLFLSVLTYLTTAVPYIPLPPSDQSTSTLYPQYLLRLDILASNLGPTWQGGSNLVAYANGTLWIGATHLVPTSEPLILLGSSSPSTSLFFTSYHAPMTSGQYLEITPNATGPITLSSPGGFFSHKEGAQITGWGFDKNGRLDWGGKNQLVGCRAEGEFGRGESYQIWWAGKGVPAGRVCTSPLVLLIEGGGYVGAFTTEGH